MKRTFLLVLVIGIILRVVLAHVVYDPTAVDWAGVAKRVSDGQTVYAAGVPYNYGPLWAGIVYSLRIIGPFTSIQSHHEAVAAFLTGVDVVTAILIARIYGIAAAQIFFLSPPSIMITAVSTQFNNLAILVGMISWMILASTKRREKLAWLVLSTVLLGLSLVIKHVLAFLPFCILGWSNFGSLKKRMLFCVGAVGIFFLSFAPALANELSRPYVIQNVFQYVCQPSLVTRLLQTVAPTLPIQVIKGLWFLGMLGIFRRYQDELEWWDLFGTYLLALVAFSPGASYEYLAIPMVGLCCLYRNFFCHLYLIVSSLAIFLSFEATPDLSFIGLGSSPALATWLYCASLIILLALIFKTETTRRAIYSQNSMLQ